MAALCCMGSLFGMGKKDAAQHISVPRPEDTRYSYVLPMTHGSPVAFQETWGYVMQSRAQEFHSSFPLTDVGLFAAEVNSYGELESIPQRSLVGDYSGRVHLVIICESRALTHFVIDPRYSSRDALLKEIVQAAKQFDGVQLDFELVPARDRENYLAFISDIKRAVAPKPVSVCVPARIRTIGDDIYPYSQIAQRCDRVIVMAYDEHWATSAPGAIASTDWCEKIADYAVAEIPAEKLVMGIPFYGRTWQTERHAGAWYNSGINRILRENSVTAVEREEGVPYFRYNTQITVTGWFEDRYSLVEKCRMYKDKKIANVAFWRVGQEDPGFWEWLEIESPLNFQR